MLVLASAGWSVLVLAVLMAVEPAARSVYDVIFALATANGLVC
jgi:hypothetical protein